jgi:hypothetical protein
LRNPLNAVSNRRLVSAGLTVLVVLVVAFNCDAAELEKETIAAFNHYVEVAEQQMDSSLHADGPFLWVDFRSESSKKKLYSQLRSGQFVIQRLETLDDGPDVDIPDGMVHHWVGIVFVPGATLKSAQAVVEDYQDYAQIYAPQIRRSKAHERDGDTLNLYLQLYKDSPRRVSYNAEFQVKRTTLSATRVESSSISTRIAQLQDPSKPDGAEYPIGDDSGYLWRMNNYWRYEQKDGGVYMQVEAISLSRDVPAVLSWFIKPIIHRVARATIADLLEANRRAIEDPRQYAPHASASLSSAANNP